LPANLSTSNKSKPLKAIETKAKPNGTKTFQVGTMPAYERIAKATTVAMRMPAMIAITHSNFLSLFDSMIVHSASFKSKAKCVYINTLQSSYGGSDGCTGAFVRGPNL